MVPLVSQSYNNNNVVGVIQTVVPMTKIKKTFLMKISTEILKQPPRIPSMLTLFEQ